MKRAGPEVTHLESGRPRGIGHGSRRSRSWPQSGGGCRAKTPACPWTRPRRASPSPGAPAQHVWITMSIYWHKQLWRAQQLQQSSKTSGNPIGHSAKDYNFSAEKWPQDWGRFNTSDRQITMRMQGHTHTQRSGVPMPRRASKPTPPSDTGRHSVGIPDTSSATVTACAESNSNQPVMLCLKPSALPHRTPFGCNPGPKPCCVPSLQSMNLVLSSACR